jgi:hypothetical protein
VSHADLNKKAADLRAILEKSTDVLSKLKSEELRLTGNLEEKRRQLEELRNKTKEDEKKNEAHKFYTIEKEAKLLTEKCM